MGGTRSKPCNQLSKLIWEWAEQLRVWLAVAHIPGCQNKIADVSRNFKDHLEWSLSNKIFNIIVSHWGMPDVDLFASCRNHKLHKFVSWHRGPEAWRVDAFSFRWDNNFYYVFPPFSIIARISRKLRADYSKAMLITPT